MSVTSVNSKFCDERHATIDARLKRLEDNVEKIMYWLVGSLAALCLNLVGIMAILFKL